MARSLPRGTSGPAIMWRAIKAESKPRRTRIQTGCDHRIASEISSRFPPELSEFPPPPAALRRSRRAFLLWIRSLKSAIVGFGAIRAEASRICTRRRFKNRTKRPLGSSDIDPATRTSSASLSALTSLRESRASTGVWSTIVAESSPCPATGSTAVTFISPANFKRSNPPTRSKNCEIWLEKSVAVAANFATSSAILFSASIIISALSESDKSERSSSYLELDTKPSFSQASYSELSVQGSVLGVNSRLTR
uniref:Uncharacterized protein n=1 Tax=Rodentolepis nana TaxID=102285 RepID=A0A0R3TAW6_RODNA